MGYEMKSPGIDELQRKTRILYPKITLIGNTVATSVRCLSDTEDIIPYIQINGVQPSTTGAGLLFLQDSGANFPTLDSTTDPTIWGLLLMVRDANPLYRPYIRAIWEDPGIATVFTLCGASSTGVTASRNLAWSMSTAGADMTTNTTFTFQLEIIYRCLGST